MIPNEVLEQLRDTPVFYASLNTRDEGKPYDALLSYSRHEKAMAESYVDAVENRMEQHGEHILDAVASITNDDLKNAALNHKEGDWIWGFNESLIQQRKFHLFNAASQFLEPQAPCLEVELMKNNLKENLLPQLSGYSGKNPRAVLDMITSLSSELKSWEMGAGMCRFNTGGTDYSQEKSYREQHSILAEQLALNGTYLDRAEHMIEQKNNKENKPTESGLSM